MLIDSNAYVIVHPRFFTNPDSITSLHLSAFEPFLMHNMYHLELVNRVYCNNFQYNSEFTRRPRKQFFYELTEKVGHFFLEIFLASGHRAYPFLNNTTLILKLLI